jgi:hypothetical protein
MDIREANLTYLFRHARPQIVRHLADRIVVLITAAW